MNRYTNKVVIVTGASNGCGAVCSIAFAKEGAKVVLADIDEDNGKQVCAHIKKDGGQALFVKTDVRVEDDVANMVKKTIETYGRLDCAFNNAGVEENRYIIEETEENYLSTMDTNVKGVFYCLKHQIPQMIKNGGGSILNHASITSNVSGDASGSIYGASKGAVIGMTKSVCLEVASQNINVNALASCGFDIEGDVFLRYIERNKIDPEKMRHQFPIKRFGKPEELAATVLFLCSSEARFIVGQTIIVDGGFTVQ